MGETAGTSRIRKITRLAASRQHAQETMISRRIFPAVMTALSAAGLVVFLVAVCLRSSADAQTYPSKLIKIIAPYTPGSPTT
jgi:GTP cyclohydrolase I